MEQKKSVFQLTEKEEKVIRRRRELKFGEVHIYVADSQCAPRKSKKASNSE